MGDIGVGAFKGSIGGAFKGSIGGAFKGGYRGYFKGSIGGAFMGGTSPNQNTSSCYRGASCYYISTWRFTDGYGQLG